MLLFLRLFYGYNSLPPPNTVPNTISGACQVFLGDGGARWRFCPARVLTDTWRFNWLCRCFLMLLWQQPKDLHCVTKVSLWQSLCGCLCLLCICCWAHHVMSEFYMCPQAQKGWGPLLYSLNVVNNPESVLGEITV